MPEPFDSVGLWYEEFLQTSDEEVKRLLESAARATTSRPASQLENSDPATVVRERALPLKGDPSQYDALLEGIGDARVVLLGEGTHGTHEFYRERAFITRRLITEKGFTGVAVEADWPDAYRINRYVRGASADEDAVQSLADFGRFPTWMWRNADVLDFIGWLRTHNDTQPVDKRAGFYGLDLYSLRASMEAVLTYLDKVDPESSRPREAALRLLRSIRRTRCSSTVTPPAAGLHPSCEREVDHAAARAPSSAGRVCRAATDASRADEFFYAEQNARLVKNAEEYYRTMFRGREESWNLRDRHMADTLQELLRFLDRSHTGARIVVWAHNSHLGDARATEMGERGELNVGQLARELHGAGAVLVGFTTYTGTVTAASEWDGPAHRKHVRPALAGSYERLFHDAQIPRFLLPLRTDPVAGVSARVTAAGASDWRPVPAGHRTREPLLPRATWPISSISSCTSTRHARSSPWKGTRCGKPARSRRRSRRVCNHGPNRRPRRSHVAQRTRWPLRPRFVLDARHDRGCGLAWAGSSRSSGACENPRMSTRSMTSESPFVVAGPSPRSWRRSTAIGRGERSTDSRASYSARWGPYATSTSSKPA